VENNMSTLNQFVGNRIKSIQRGTISIGAVSTSATATITSVDTTKSILIQLGSNGAQNNTYSVSSTDGYLVLTNATTITANKGVSGTSNIVIVSYQIVEYY
jgi:hypothetical protein